MPQYWKLTAVLFVSCFLSASLCAVENCKTLCVEDFGAVADGETDCTEAFERAIAAANEQGPGVTVQLGKGTYILTSEVPGVAKGGQDTSHLEGRDKEDYELYKQVNKFKVPSCIKLENVHGVTLAGQGVETEIIVTCPMAGMFELWNCSDIVMRDFCVDYDPIPFTQGTITAVDVEAGTFDYKIDSGFEQLDKYWFLKSDSRWGVVFDEERKFRQGGISAIFCRDWEKLGDSLWQMNLHYVKQGKGLKLGDRYIHIARTHNPVIGFYQCTNAHLDNLQIYASPSSSVIFFRCEGDIHVENLQAKPRPGSGRIFGPNADGVHCQSLRKGPLIENCVFEGMADDATNVYTLPSVITEVVASDKIRIDDPQVLRKGDCLQIIRPSSGVILEAGMEVADVNGNLVTLTKPVEGLIAGKNHVEADTVFNLSACGNGFIIRNNLIGSFRGRGILAKGHHGVIENNVIRDTSGQGIVVQNDPDWPEGPIPADIMIRNNTLIGVYRDEQQGNGGAIHLSALQLRYKVAESPGFENVVLENNRIIDPPKNAILLQGVKNAKLTDNMVQLTANDRPIKKYCGIKLENCADIQIDGFTMVDQWARIEAGVILNDTKIKEVTLKDVCADVGCRGELITVEK